MTIDNPMSARHLKARSRPIAILGMDIEAQVLVIS
jgi:hypothetical protein